MKKSNLLKASAASVLALAATATSTEAHAAKGDMEKCYGVVKSGMNDCGSNGHSCASAGRHECAAEKHGCAGMAKHDKDLSEWVYLPKGTCDKLAGSSLTKNSGKNKTMKNM
jgi:uncharacterized membrane protein